MSKVVSATEARVHFGEMMRRVTEENTPIIVERAGKPKIVMVSVSEYERMQAAQAQQISWQEQLRQARVRVAAELGDRELPPADQIIREMREERDAQLLDMR